MTIRGSIDGVIVAWDHPSAEDISVQSLAPDSNGVPWRHLRHLSTHGGKGQSCCFETRTMAIANWKMAMYSEFSHFSNGDFCHPG